MEITFKSDTKHRKRFLTAKHFSHPAKMVLPLQRWLIENYTKCGDKLTITSDVLYNMDKDIEWCDCENPKDS